MASLHVRVGDVTCAVPVEHVVETMRPLPIERVAGAPPFVLGLSVVRGRPVPIIELGALLGADHAPNTSRVVTLRVDDREVGLAVDSVLGVVDDGDDEMPGLPPLLSQAGAGVVAAIASLDTRLLLLLRAARLVPDQSTDIAPPGQEPS